MKYKVEVPNCIIFHYLTPKNDCDAHFYDSNTITCKKQAMKNEEFFTTMLVHKYKDMSLKTLNLVEGMYLQPFEGVYNICTYNMIKVAIIWIRTYNMDTFNHKRYMFII